MSYSVNIKQSGAGDTFAIQVEDTTTIAEMKNKCIEAKPDLEIE
jgi:hypothetical protein